jgi:uncharacterized membrane protein YidH (DUF202 family)
MMTSEDTLGGFYSVLTARGVLGEAELQAAVDSARARGLELEAVLIHEKRVPKDVLLKTLSEYYGLPSIRYDERMPVPPELLDGLDDERLYYSRWFPVIKDGDTVIVAAADPRDPEVIQEAKEAFKGHAVVFMAALTEDIRWFIQDFLHTRPGLLIGTERTGLAYWRNTLAQWRTRLACYRTDLARVRTDLASLRGGLGLVAISDALIRADKLGMHARFHWALLLCGAGVAAYGLTGYLRIRGAKMKQPGHHTLVEVTAASTCFLENYHYAEGAHAPSPSRKTMLARLGDLLGAFSTILYPSPASRERTHLARERNVLAAGRTVDACHRTIYARARTGLAFIRTGVSFTSLGLGLLGYYGISGMSVFDLAIIAAGLFMLADGVRWYMPVRREQASLARCPTG